MKNIITINGRPYDAITGMPAIAKQPVGATAAKPASQPSVRRPSASLDGMSLATKPSRKANHAASKHRRTQRSQTLHRSALKRPEGLSVDTNGPVTVGRSSMITRFSSHKAHKASKPLHHSERHENASPIKGKLLATKQDRLPASTQTNSETQPTAAPAPQTRISTEREAVARTAPSAVHIPAASLSGNALKEQLIREQLNEVEQQHSTLEPPAKTRRAPRAATIIASISALILLGGYLTYLNMPSLSMRVAAAQAGIDASYPSYQPAGYSFSGPVAFSPGEVRVNFQSNTNDYRYSLIQRASGWDSHAVLDNYVLKETQQYATLQERGLTIYLMQNKAAWVNGGVLYVIDGNAPLSSEQIQKIASSTL